MPSMIQVTLLTLLTRATEAPRHGGISTLVAGTGPIPPSDRPPKAARVGNETAKTNPLEIAVGLVFVVSFPRVPACYAGRPVERPMSGGSQWLTLISPARLDRREFGGRGGQKCRTVKASAEWLCSFWASVPPWPVAG